MFSQRTNWQLHSNRYAQELSRLMGSRPAGSILDLTVSNPAESGLGHDAETLRAATSAIDLDGYAPDAKGLLTAREAVSDYYRELSPPRTVEPQDVLLTTSTSEGYAHLFRLLCDPGDEVLVPRPSYPLFEHLAALHDVTLIPYSLVYDHGWQYDETAIRTALTARTRALMLVHPNNPTGSFVKPLERAWMQDICSRHNLAMIVDEVFLDFPAEGASAESFAGGSEALTFVLSGLSKIAGLPQLKVAWIAVSGPQEQKKAALERLEIISDAFLSLNTPVQSVLPKLLELRHAFQQRLRLRLAHNRRELPKDGGPGPMTSLHCEGGWYATLRVPRVQSDEDLTIQLMREHGVVVYPGHFFDFESEGHLVVSLMTPEATFCEGMRRIASHLSRS